MVTKQTYNNICSGTMSIIQNIMSCMRGYRSSAYVSGKSTKIKFGVPLEKLSQKSCHHLPKPLFDLLVYLAQEGIKTNDLFRRPGNSTQMKKIIDMLSSGVDIEWSEYNLYTVANVVKKYFISLPGGLFGRKYESMLLATHRSTDDDRRATFHRILQQMPIANRELAILMFGILFRMVSHCVDEYSMEAENNRDKKCSSDSKCTEFVLAEAVAKSVAGSIFHLCTSSPENVEKAASVLRGLILDFPSFDEEYVDFYYGSTLIPYGNLHQRYFQFAEMRNQPQNEIEITIDSCQTKGNNVDNIPTSQKKSNPRTEYYDLPVVMLTNPFGGIESMSTDSSPVLKKKFKDEDDISLKSTRSSDYDRVQQRQMDLMRLRSDWFLKTGSCNYINRNPTNSSQYGYYESNEGSISMNSDSNLQFQISATSGPDILQTLPHLKRNPVPNIKSFNLTVPNRADVVSYRSSELSSIGNTSRNSFIDEVYSDY